MKTLNEKIIIMTEALNGGQIELKSIDGLSKPWRLAASPGTLSWDWVNFDYRVRPNNYSLAEFKNGRRAVDGRGNIYRFVGLCVDCPEEYQLVTSTRDGSSVNLVQFCLDGRYSLNTDFNNEWNLLKMVD